MSQPPRIGPALAGGGPLERMASTLARLDEVLDDLDDYVQSAR